MGKPTPDEIEEHVLICEMCQERLQFTDEFIAAMRAALPVLPVLAPMSILADKEHNSSTRSPGMDTWPGTTLRYCNTCQKETPHEIRAGVGRTAKLCVECSERALMNELERDRMGTK